MTNLVDSVSTCFGAFVSRFFLKSGTGLFEDTTSDPTGKTIIMPANGIMKHAVDISGVVHAHPPGHHPYFLRASDEGLFEAESASQDEPLTLTSGIRALVEPSASNDTGKWAMLCIPVQCFSGNIETVVGMVVIHSRESFDTADQMCLKRMIDLFAMCYQFDLMARTLKESEERVQTLDRQLTQRAHHMSDVASPGAAKPKAAAWHKHLVSVGAP